MSDASDTSTNDTTAAAVVAATGLQVMTIGSTWMMDPATAERGAEVGLPGRTFWAVGRGGVLGDVDADVVAAAYGFIEPTMLRGFWEARPATMAPQEAALHYAGAAAAWGRRVLGSLGEAALDELAALAASVAAGSLAGVGGLFAGWRAFDASSVAGDPAGRATVALHVLREHRGCAHVSAVLAAGLTPIQSIMCLPESRGGGVPRAERFGWPAPYPDVAQLASARAEAEAITDRIAAPAYEALSPAQRARFAELVGQAHRLATGTQ